MMNTERILGRIGSWYECNTVNILLPVLWKSIEIKIRKILVSQMLPKAKQGLKKIGMERTNHKS